MGANDFVVEKLQEATDAALEGAASRLRRILAEVATRVRPFPAFLNMVSVQAVELEPALGPASGRGCVVVLPGGEICQLDLMILPGVQGIMDADHLEEFAELDLPAEEYIVYAATAIRVLAEELARRGVR